MNVLHLVGGDLRGGASRGALWLHQGLNEIGVKSFILTNDINSNPEKGIFTSSSNKWKHLLSKLRAGCDKLPLNIYKTNNFFSPGIFGFDFTKTLLFKQADIIHLHWINKGFINIKHLKKIKKPIVWTIRDMWPFTGGCHYSCGCEKFKANCGACPQLGSSNNYDLSKLILSFKKRHLPKTIRFVGISEWISSIAKESSLLEKFEITTIHNCISFRDFFPIKKDIAKQALNIDTSKKIILCGAYSMGEKYKGFDKYIKALKQLDQKVYYLVFFGNTEEKILRNIGFEYKNYGFIKDLISLRLLYSCADVFVAPSIMEAFGKTLIEAMSCGTPVVCFDATGPKDIVTHKHDGYKAIPYEDNDLATGIKWIIENQNYNQISENARRKAMSHFSDAIIAKKYLELYEDCLYK